MASFCRPNASAFICAFALAIPAAFLPLAASASTRVVPNAQASIEGGTNASYPFGQASMRYQQVYAASEFPSPMSITGITFRPDATSGNAFGPVTLTNVTIILSTTTAGPGALSTAFANNQGPDHVTVLNGSATVSSAFSGSAGGPKTFDVTITFSTPFSYDPGRGNLLVDVKINGSGSTISSVLDAQSTTGQTCSRVYATSAGATVATGSDWKSLITRFTYTKKLVWFIYSDKLNGVIGINPTIADHFFNNNLTYVASGYTNGNIVPAGYASVAVGTFKAYGGANGLTSNLGSIASNIHTLIYDNEHWSDTPVVEQQSPGSYMAQFSTAAHNNGYHVIDAPARDLVPQQSGYDSSKDIGDQYLSMGFPQKAANAPADSYDIQAQYYQTTATMAKFTSFTTSASNQARAANPYMQVIAGLTTQNSGGAFVNAQIMHDAAVSVTGKVSGFWINCPDNDFQKVVSFLGLMQADGY